jgi:hypothetical protein
MAESSAKTSFKLAAGGWQLFLDHACRTAGGSELSTGGWLPLARRGDLPSNPVDLPNRQAPPLSHEPRQQWTARSGRSSARCRSMSDARATTGNATAANPHAAGNTLFERSKFSEARGWSWQLGLRELGQIPCHRIRRGPVQHRPPAQRGRPRARPLPP